DVQGIVATKGRVTGPMAALHAVGDATVTRLEAPDLSALTTAIHYDATIPASDAARTSARVDGHAEFVTILGRAVEEISGNTTYEPNRLGFDLRVSQQRGPHGELAGTMVLAPDRDGASIPELTVTLGNAAWRLRPPDRASDGGPAAATVSWNDAG